MKRVRSLITAMLIVGVNALTVGCSSGAGSQEGQTGGEVSTAEKEVVFERVEVAVAEAEDGELSGGVSVNTDKDKGTYSGSGYVSGFEKDSDKASVKVNIDKADFYDLDLICCEQGGYKENKVFVDGEFAGTVAGNDEKFSLYTVPRVYLSEGEHIISLEKSWGWVCWDKVSVMTVPPFDNSIYEVSKELCNPEASENAKRVMSYLVDNYGKNVISGQYCDGGAFGHEMAVIWKEAGKFPAMVGLDMIEYSPSRVENGSVGTSIEKAIEAWDNNCLITMCWHWNSPSKYLKDPWYSGFYKEYTTIDLDKIMSGKDEEGYKLLVSDMDVIASELTKLRDLDIPVLWRPLHEASGGWFWWGDCNAESYKKLYDLMYDKFVNEYKLNNLIWVWNGQSDEWYPGDDKVDIIGEDIYPGTHVYTSQYPKYIERTATPGVHKIVALSENGCMFDPDLAIRDGAMWSYFGTWSGEFVSGSESLNIYSEEYTESEMLKKVYQHENVITRDELPDLKSYPVDGN